MGVTLGRSRIGHFFETLEIESGPTESSNMYLIIFGLR
jgi:hypothetical protein